MLKGGGFVVRRTRQLDNWTHRVRFLSSWEAHAFWHTLTGVARPLATVLCRISLVHTCLFDIPSNIVPNTLRFPANIFHRLVTRVCLLCVPHVLSMLLFLGSYFVSTICYTFPHYAFLLGVCRFALVRSIYFLQLFVGRHPHLCSFRRMRQNIVRENLFFFF